jgi:aryl-alcohol dehydrogenase-like predicted oxidoreductase
VVLATKVTGPGHGWFRPPVRHGMTALDRVQITRAAEASLRRLGTDYLDLYQTHWPDHGGRYGDVLGVLDDLVRAGKVRVAGCSNETCWGLMKSLWTSEAQGLVRLDSVQNNFSLLNRRCESELAQVCRQEQVSLIPYSPLAGGVLTGKYQDGALPAGARFSGYLQGGGERQKKMAARFVNPRTLQATSRFLAIARDLGTNPAALATAWSRSHDFVASTLVGATTVAQLDESLQAERVVISDEARARIDAVEAEIPLSFGEDGLRGL